MKLKIVLASLLLVCLMLSFGTNANFATQSKTRNVITTNNVEIELIEKQENENGEIIDFDSKITHKVVPGDSYSKIPYVKNIGTEPCFVRINIETENYNNLIFDINKNWIALKDNWYVYNEIVEVGGQTNAIFTSVSFPISMGNEFLDKEIKVNLKADAVQSKYNENYIDICIKESEG